MNIIISAFELVVVFAIPGLAIAHIIHSSIKKPLDIWEYIAIASAGSLLATPLILLIENTIIGRIHLAIPFLNSALLLAWAIYVGRKKRIPNIRDLAQPIWIFALLLYISINFILSTAYTVLPESDPYYWIQRFEDMNITGIFYNLNRPLFYALYLIFIDSANMHIFTYFKYILPALSIFSLLPAILLARKFANTPLRITILAVPLFAPSTILYSQVPFPQAISIVLMYYFFFFLLYSAFTKNNFFYIVAGLIALSSYFYHELGIFLFIAWAIVTLYSYRKNIVEYLLRNKAVTTLLALLVIPYFSVLGNITTFVWYWFMKIVNNARGINWKFPAEYINVDGNSVGWAGSVGLLQYYSYYVGPVLLITTGFFLFVLVTNRKFRIFVKEKFHKYPEIQIVTIVGILFFTVSEILPRAGSIALLPERMWTVGSIFLAIVPMSLVYFYKGKQRTAIASGIVLCVSISIGASIYINNQKKYVIPDYQLASAEWIIKNLPSNRMFYTTDNNTLLQVYAHSQTTQIPSSLLCSDAIQHKNVLPPPSLRATDGISKRNVAIKQIIKETTNYLTSNAIILVPNLISFITPSLIDLNNQSVQSASTALSQQSKAYIYFAKPDERNPYLRRPYIKNISTCSMPNFSKYPEQYGEVYNDTNRVIIWEIK